MRRVRAKRLVRAAVVRFSIASRERKARLLGDWLDARGSRTVLLVGAGGAEDTAANANIVENRIAEGRVIVAGFNIYPRTAAFPWLVADARAMPFKDRCVDFALSSAIIEHVGDEDDQRRFVAEHSRVARSWAITTPNRWFPVESHTSVLLRHWSPGWRAGRPEFTRLLSRREFRALLPPGTVLVGRPWSATFTALYDTGDGANRLTGAAQATAGRAG